MSWGAAESKVYLRMCGMVLHSEDIHCSTVTPCSKHVWMPITARSGHNATYVKADVHRNQGDSLTK